MAQFDIQGLVTALPGVCGLANQGSNGPKSSGDTLPIVMRDRVHVQGVGARRCVLRGVGEPGQTQPVFWPNAATGVATTPPPTTSGNVEILLSLTKVYAGIFGPGSVGQPPWYDAANAELDTVEVFEGFTFQGGDIQAAAKASFISSSYTVKAIIANCIFDMRHGWKVDPSDTATISGPYFGIMMSKGYVPDNLTTGGYVDTNLLIANNTFIMSQHGANGWEYMCRPSAVGVIDVTDPGCGPFVLRRDCDQTLRGVGNCGLINNVFRTQPYTATGNNPEPFAMLGIDDRDTLIPTDTDPFTIQTNAFAPLLVGATNKAFYSQPVLSAISVPAQNDSPALWDCGGLSMHTGTLCTAACTPNHTCVTATLPAPAVEIYDGTATQKDPGFVGEYLATTFAATLSNYADWRLLPESPLKDRGWAPVSTPSIVYVNNGASWNLSSFVGNTILDLDGEGYGNPRVIDGSPDIGFDELQFFTMAGSWGNFSNSHNHLDLPLDGDAPAGATTRCMIFPQSAGGINIASNNVIRVTGRKQAAPQVPPAPTAWFQPPATLARTASNTSLPFDYRTKYIGFNSQAPTPWSEVVSQLNHFKTFTPVGNATLQSLNFVLVTRIDDECAGGTCSNEYFNTQALLQLNDSGGADLLWSNMQAEYR